MINYPENITEEDILDALDSTLERVYKLAKDADCNMYTDVDADEFLPTVVISTGDDLMTVEVETREVESDDGEEGYEFIPSIDNGGLVDDMNLDNHDELVERFEKWAKIAKLADALYCTEFYPTRYFD